MKDLIKNNLKKINKCFEKVEIQYPRLESEHSTPKAPTLSTNLRSAII